MRERNKAGVISSWAFCPRTALATGRLNEILSLSSTVSVSSYFLPSRHSDKIASEVVDVFNLQVFLDGHHLMSSTRAFGCFSCTENQECFSSASERDLVCPRGLVWSYIDKSNQLSQSSSQLRLLADVWISLYRRAEVLLFLVGLFNSVTERL